MQEITTGTEKQNQFAEDVREQMYSTIQGTLTEMQAHPKCPEQYKSMTVEEYLAMDAPMIPELRKALQIEDHRFWLDTAKGRVSSRADLQDLVKQPAFSQYV